MRRGGLDGTYVDQLPLPTRFDPVLTDGKQVFVYLIELTRSGVATILLRSLATSRRIAPSLHREQIG